MLRHYALYQPPEGVTPGNRPWLFGFDTDQLVNGEAPVEVTVPDKPGSFRRISRTLLSPSPRAARTALLNEVEPAAHSPHGDRHA